MIPAFLICLERLRGNACQETNLHEVFPHNLTNVFPAVDASLLSLKDDRISPFARYHIKQSLDTDFIHTSKLSAVGCSLSHIALWEQAVAFDMPIIVLEDDVQLDKTFMQTAIDAIPADADFASIVYLPFADRSSCSEEWCNIQPRSGFGGTQMYYITPRGASILLEQALPIVSQIDVYIGYVANTRADFKAIFYEKEYFTQYQFWSEYSASTIGHNIEIKKFLPENNWFYLAWVALIFLWAIFALWSMLSCQKKQKTYRSKV
tara:strand:+ start:247 stop:1035 length:789 start_codon:yes stop_codon:yes gene_type:complete